MKHSGRYLQVRKNISVLGSEPLLIKLYKPCLFSRLTKNSRDIKNGKVTQKSRGANSEEGSISVVVIGLFIITVASLMVMTDVSAMIVAKRSLVQATEAAAQRGVHTLDKREYYQGKGTIFTVPLAVATGREHPTIPIDCTRGGVEVLLELNSWSNDQSDMKWRQLKGIELTEFSCDGKSLQISTRSEMKLPFKLPFADTDSVFLTATAGTTNNVQEGFYLFGVRVY
jgi:hypothetical protein